MSNFELSESCFPWIASKWLRLSLPNASVRLLQVSHHVINIVAAERGNFWNRGALDFWKWPFYNCGSINPFSLTVLYNSSYIWRIQGVFFWNEIISWWHLTLEPGMNDFIERGKIWGVIRYSATLQKLAGRVPHPSRSDAPYIVHLNIFFTAFFCIPVSNVKR